MCRRFASHFRPQTARMNKTSLLLLKPSCRDVSISLTLSTAEPLRPPDASLLCYSTKEHYVNRKLLVVEERHSPMLQQRNSRGGTKISRLMIDGKP